MRTVNPVGPTDSPLLALVGEAPGAEETKRGIPFVGYSGHLLDQLLAVVGLSRHECYITNVVNQQPPKNNFGIYYTDAKRTKPTMDLLQARARVKAELFSVKPQVIVLLGNEALKAVANVVGIKKYRGCMMDTTVMCHPVRVMPTYHPAHLLRMYGDRPIVELDLMKAVRQARRPYKPEMEFTVLPTFDQVMEFFRAKHSPVAFDIETFHPVTRSLGFAWSGSEAISIPLVLKGHHAWSSEQEGMILQSLNAYLGDPEIKKYLQNAPYDTTVIAKELGLHINGLDLDTMYAQHLLYPELPKGLDFLSSVYTDFPKYWGLDNQSTDDGNATYGCYDCCATYISAIKIQKELEERKLMLFYKARVHPTIFALTRMQNRGIKVDEKNRDLVHVQTSVKLTAALQSLHKIVGYEVNPNSPKQISKLVYDEWKLPKQKKPHTKVVTTDDDALRTLARKYHQHAIALRLVLTCRQTRKLISTYIETKLDNGRARTSYGLTKTGRISSSQTIEGFGGNLQNIPRGDFRRLYVADEGKVLIKADLKQAEYMVFAWDAPVPELIHEYTTNPEFDVHRLNASRIFDIPESEVDKDRRYAAKQGVYAGNYGIGPLKMSRMYDMEFALAKTVLERYKSIRPELAVWWRRIEDEIRTTRTLTNPLGRVRIFFGRIDAALFRVCYDFIPQSTVADLINQALVTLDELGVQCLLQVHDELVVQCNNDPFSIDATVVAVREAMEIPVTFPGVDVPMVIPAEISVGPNWHDTKEYANGKI